MPQDPKAWDQMTNAEKREHVEHLREEAQRLPTPPMSDAEVAFILGETIH